VQTGCSLDAVEALLKAGSDPNAKAKGGATPLMMADVFQRADVAQALRKAGANPWK
jgi:ankyrin repeat protein